MIAGVIVIGFGIFVVKSSAALTQEELNNKFITHNPLDLSQIRGFSKYRSCAGHDFRDPAAVSGKKEATPRSMKHYIKVRSDLSGKNGIVKALAPFDGKIYEIDDDNGGPGDQAIWLTPDSISPRQWQFIFYHIALIDGLEEGSKVKAGQIIGTANLKRAPGQETDNFDMAVKFMRPLRRPAVDAPFSHMAANVLDEFGKYGITENDVNVSEKERDANPCTTIPKPSWGEGDDVYFSSKWSADDVIWFK